MKEIAICSDKYDLFGRMGYLFGQISNLCIKIAFLTEILNKTIRPGNDEIVAKAKVGYIHV